MNHLRLDLQFFSQEKTEEATPKKREDSRKKGQVAKSQDVNTALLLFAVFLILFVVGGFLRTRFTTLFEQSFSEYITWEVTQNTVHEIMFESTMEMASTLAPIMGMAILAGLASNFLQIGVLFTGEPLKIDLKKLNPIQGAKKIFAARALVELVKSLLKIGFVGSVTFSILWFRREDMMEMSQKGLEAAVAFFGQTTVIMGLAASLLLLVLSVIDYTYQRYDHEKNIRMSKQDVKDEHKNIEGDPQIKSKIKERQRQMSQQRMMSEVPEADVVITNPTHYAVAIKYDESKAQAPYVVAKGVDYVALKIREIAKQHDVVTVENRSLARAMYDSVEIDNAIGEEYYQAVAEILAYVYRIQKKA
ncbi:flagellar biosynthesis protein FlhB [Pontibacillus yanchengensis]|uniref:Flagellar biosynthesis protein FlhB n=2 Tax=Pontibacillus yanchengensis TaxID=462910 RepID=A0ACC7VBA5_9BACI|nr:flagellar biosynthesis protein FlhB [Pontibacillus yanchengensis]MYL33158.1 flagellar biosynthesis protein FlhB [Pontibacillus yanchengensis]MYL51992.1 flagellar biosynthesis protein FlhB [Pontibacillus yanchengensis]